MRFNIATLFALAATTQLVAGVPMPVKWNDKDMEAHYKTATRVCGAAGYACRETGHNTAGNILFGAAAISGAAEVAVTASQGKTHPKVAGAVAHHAVAGGKAIGNGLAAVGKCFGDACVAGYKKATGHNRGSGSSSHARSVEMNEATALLSQE